MSHSQAYQEFLLSLEKLNNEFLIGSEDIDLPSLKAEFQTIKLFFQSHIATIQELDEAIAMQWQSLQTELYRELRLLETDILFFASSRAAETKLQRLRSLRERIERMIKYCQAILKLL
ncbi:MAG: heterocyst frequency control protein PatD [Xenococcaceae cyanobacterium]